MKILHIPTAIEYVWNDDDGYRFDDMGLGDYIFISERNGLCAEWSLRNDAKEVSEGDGYYGYWDQFHRPKYEFCVREDV